MTHWQGQNKWTRDPGQDLTANPHKRFAQLRSVHMRPHFNFAEALIKNVKTDTIW